MKKQKEHSCPICENYHWIVRRNHGWFIQDVRDALEYLQKKIPSYGGWAYWNAYKKLTDYERTLEASDRYCRRTDWETADRKRRPK